ncbi:hypothetical protein CRG98_031079 [Punica granatum]|uniref:Uncharacterized protein n=1 Tax=Punica granatum TaxID=22663 RepID=A0A2I0IWX4_PUNGR|nr:hypothetical protein CRG98_031079 [Punica granatum]
METSSPQEETSRSSEMTDEDKKLSEIVLIAQLDGFMNCMGHFESWVLADKAVQSPESNLKAMCAHPNFVSSGHERNPNHATKSRIYLFRKVEGLLCKIKKSPDESGRIGPAGPKEKPPGREAGPDWNSLGLNGPSLQRKRNGPRPVSRRVAEIGGSGGDEAGGGGSRPWTPRRRPEWTREITLGTADVSPWSIGTLPALNQSESGELSRFSSDDFGRFGGNRDLGLPGPVGIAGSRRALPGPARPARLARPARIFFFF